MGAKDETLEFLKKIDRTCHDIGNSIPRMKNAIKAFCRVFNVEEPYLDYRDYKTQVGLQYVIPKKLFFLLGLVEVVQRAYKKLTAEIVSENAIEGENGGDSEMEEDQDNHEDSKQEENNDDQEEEVKGAVGPIPSTSEVSSFQMLNDFLVPENMASGSDKPMHRKSDCRLTSRRMNSNGVLTQDIVTGPFGSRGFRGFGPMKPVDVHGFKIKDLEDVLKKDNEREEIIDRLLEYVNSEIEENLKLLKERGNKDDSEQGENKDDSKQGENNNGPEEVDVADELSISFGNLVISDKNVSGESKVEPEEEKEKGGVRPKRKVNLKKKKRELMKKKK